MSKEQQLKFFETLSEEKRDLRSPTADSDIEKNRKIACLSYLSILCLIPLFWRRESKFAQFHARQGLILLFIELILPLFNIIPFLGQVVWVSGLILLLVYSVLGIRYAWQGRFWEMPYLGYYAKRIKL